MQKIKVNKQTIVFVSLSLALLGLLFIFIPAGVRKISRANRQINDFNQKISLIQSEWPQKENYQEKNKELERDIEKYKRKAIPPGFESRLISYISESSLNYDIKIQSITPRDSLSSPVGAFNYLPFRIEAVGGFYGLKGFLDFLYEGDYFFELKELSLVGHNPSRINMVLWGLRKN